jgi:hypothetical protein
MKLALVISALAVALTGCGGGGGGNGSQSISTDSANPVLAGVGIFGASSNNVLFQYYRDGSTANPVSFMHPHDIDGDGIDEIFFVAFEAKSSTGGSYSNTSVHILGWENGVFKEITSRWLPGTTNQVEGVGDLCFGDFNRDGKTDVFLSSYTDTDLAVHPYALMNTGTTLNKVELTAQSWMHSVACGDINGDGYDDVFAAGWGTFPAYLGSNVGLIEYSGNAAGAGVVLGDFLGTGVMQYVVTESGSSHLTKLYSFTVDTMAHTVGVTYESSLPAPRIDTKLGTAGNSHDVRVRALDFNSDGRLDIVVFSRHLFASATEDVYRSEIQFLANTGAGNFVDVTDTVLVGYDTHSSIGYFPQFKDFNQDGKLDLFVSQPEWNSYGYKGASMLIQNSSKQFVNTSKTSLSKIIELGGGQAAIAQGPNSKFFLIKESTWKNDGWTYVSAHPINF